MTFEKAFYVFWNYYSSSEERWNGCDGKSLNGGATARGPASWVEPWMTGYMTCDSRIMFKETVRSISRDWMGQPITPLSFVLKDIRDLFLLIYAKLRICEPSCRCSFRIQTKSKAHRLGPLGWLVMKAYEFSFWLNE